MESELVADYQCEIGEGPLWHPFERCLYWLDIPHGRIFRYDPLTRHHEQVEQGDPVGGFTIQADGALLLLARPGLSRSGEMGSAQSFFRRSPLSAMGASTMSLPTPLAAFSAGPCR